MVFSVLYSKYCSSRQPRHTPLLVTVDLTGARGGDITVSGHRIAPVTSGHGAHLETTVSSFVVINIPPVLGSVSTPQLHGDQCQCGHPAPLIATTRQCNTAGLGAERDQSCHPPKSNCWPGRDTGEEHNTSHKTHYIANSALPAATQLLLAPSPISILLMRITEILLIHGRLQSRSKRHQQDTNSSSLRIVYFTLFSIDYHLVMKSLNT